MNRVRTQLLGFIEQKSWWHTTSKLLLSLLVLSLSGQVIPARAETDEQVAPQDLVETISKIDKAANDQNLESLLKYYEDSFSNEDGMTVAGVQSALEKVWLAYPELTYETQILSWSEDQGELVAETQTKIIGSQENKSRVINLESVIKSRQYFKDRKLLRQEVLSEKTTVTSGDRPPKITVNLPETVKLGEKYAFDTIVEEPLDGNILLGAAIEEKTASNLYLNPTSIELEQLSAGGIFKTVTAPRLSDNHWLSAIVVRGDGITMVTQRVRVEE